MNLVKEETHFIREDQCFEHMNWMIDSVYDSKIELVERMIQ